MLISNISAASLTLGFFNYFSPYQTECYLVHCCFPKQTNFPFWTTPYYFILGLRKLQFSLFLIFFQAYTCFYCLFSVSCLYLDLCIRYISNWGFFRQFFNLWPISAERFYFYFIRFFFFSISFCEKLKRELLKTDCIFQINN